MKIRFLQNTNDLIQKAALGEPKAQKRIYDKYSPTMLSVCRQYISDIASAESVMVAGFFKVFKNIDRYEQRGSFEGWIRKIMIHEALNYLKANKSLRFSENLEEVDIPIEQSEPDVDIEYLQVLIDELPDEMKIVFNLYVLDGYKHTEIAELLDISENASKLRLSRAKAKLRTAILDLKNKRHA